MKRKCGWIIVCGAEGGRGAGGGGELYVAPLPKISRGGDPHSFHTPM